MRWSGLLSITMYFYSRPCGRGDSRFRFQQAHDAISTHAPAGGATLASEVLHIDLCISTHAPAGGATRPALSPSRTENISTHAPAGGATRPAGCSGKARPISTHAPAGGATKAVCHRHVGAVFLLTPLREGRPMRGDSPIFCYIFLLTPLREGRQLLAAYSSYVSNFYSRPCGRGDASVASTAAQPFSISTHAPAGGATIVFLDGHLAGRDISTHAPAGGATVAMTSIFATSVLFLLTPLREGRQQFSTSPS